MTVIITYDPSHSVSVKETHSITKLLKRTVCDGPARFVQTDFSVVDVQNSWSCYCRKHYVQHFI